MSCLHILHYASYLLLHLCENYRGQLHGLNYIQRLNDILLVQYCLLLTTYQNITVVNDSFLWRINPMRIIACQVTVGIMSLYRIRSEQSTSNTGAMWSFSCSWFFWLNTRKYTSILGAIHKLRHTNFMIFLPLPVTFLRPPPT